MLLLSMKVLAGLFWASAALETYTVVGEAFVYISEPLSRHAQAESPSISPRTARLIFAQRLGLSQYHSLEGVDQSDLDNLNTFGGEQRQTFAPDDTLQGTEKLLLVVEGVGQGSVLPAEVLMETFTNVVIEILSPSAVPAFKIEPQPSSSQNLELAIDLLNQDRDSKQKGQNPCHFEIPGRSFLRGGFSSLHLVG